MTSLAGRSNQIEASHTGGMDAMSVDTEVTGNAATSLGALDSCIEAAPGDTITLDVTATNIPAGFEMMAFSYTVNYDEAALTIETQDHEFLLAANFPSAIFNASEETPDIDGNGSWIASVADIGGGRAESGSGVLSRLTVSVALDAASGIRAFLLTGATHGDNLNEYHSPDVMNDGAIAVGVPCPPSGSPTPSPVQTPVSSPSPTPTLPMTGLVYDAEAWLRLSDNYTVVTGAVICSVPVEIAVSAQVSQWVRHYRVAGSSVVTQPCSGLTRWTVEVGPLGGRFKPGEAELFLIVSTSGYPGLGDTGQIRLKPGSVK